MIGRAPGFGTPRVGVIPADLGNAGGAAGRRRAAGCEDARTKRIEADKELERFGCSPRGVPGPRCHATKCQVAKRALLTAIANTNSARTQR